MTSESARRRPSDETTRTLERRAGLHQAVQRPTRQGRRALRAARLLFPGGGHTQLREELDSLLRDVEVDFGGGCSVSKAHVLAWLIRAGRVRRSIDIGVYRGRSFFPQALAHRKYTGGTVFGVDPYQKAAARQTDRPALVPAFDEFIGRTDFDGIHEQVLEFSRSNGLSGNSKIVRLKSAQAATKFAARKLRFGLIHIDGNHDAKSVMSDVRAYTPLLTSGGFLVLDDISWPSVRPANSEASDRLLLLLARVDSRNDYAVYWNPPQQTAFAELAAASLRRNLEHVSRERL